MQHFSFAGWYSQNGNGEMTGTTWVEESGFLEGPVLITNTHSVGVVRDAVIAWRVAHGPADATDSWWSLPVVAETWDGWLNDINGFHVKPEHVFHALDSARSGPVEEGAVGGGTGMICNGFKGGIGTSSRRLTDKDGGYMLGVLVQCNYGTRQNLRIAGIPVGREIESEDPYAFGTLGPRRARLDHRRGGDQRAATAASAEAHRAARVARHRAHGSIAGNGSGDIFIAFSTANPAASDVDHVVDLKMLPNDSMDPLFAATVQATEEAIVNAMVAAPDMTGIDGHHVRALPHDELRAVLAKYNRLTNERPPRAGRLVCSRRDSEPVSRARPGSTPSGPREDRAPVDDGVPQHALVAAIQVAMQRVEVERDDAASARERRSRIAGPADEILLAPRLAAHDKRRAVAVAPLEHHAAAIHRAVEAGGAVRHAQPAPRHRVHGESSGGIPRCAAA